MPKKIKLNDAAKDFNVTAQTIVEFFADRGDTKKKASSSITVDEMNLLIEHFTNNNRVDSFDDYFATANQPKEIPEPVKTEPVKNEKKSPKKEAESMKDTQPKSKADTKSKPNNNAPKATDTPKANNNAPKATDTPKANNNAPKTNNGLRPNTNVSKTADNKTSKTNNNTPKNNRTANSMQKFENVKSNVQNNESKKPDNKKVDTKKVDNKKTSEKTKLNTVVSSETSESIVQRRTVDTRGSYVDLDKYNDRYEQIASTNKHAKNKDNYGPRKQKINQKSANRNKQQYARKETEAEKLKRIELERARKQQIKVLIPEEITVSELAIRLKKTAAEVIKKLMGMGVMATINQEIDFDTACLVAEELGAKVEKEVIVTIEERLIDISDDNDVNLKPRCPVVVVMGHVDHGKTSILDRIRNANVTASEAGGITQHIGAYQVNCKGQKITFLDTPGHEAFTSMRARGANITDIAILVVAADDGIMPQTIESINHAKAAGVQIIVAMNKIDKEAANPDRVRQELTEHGIVCEEWGGDVMCVPVSAKTGEGIDVLLENILLIAEFQELKANPDRLATGTVIDARLDKGRGPIATILVQNGTLHTGDIIIAGTSVGRVRVMTNHRGKVVKVAGPSVPVEITGLADVPSAGDIFNAVEDERLARTLVEQRKHEAKEQVFNNVKKVTLENLFSCIAEGEMKELPIIVKADVQGSVEAVKQSLEKISNEEVRVRVIHGGVGAVKESDVMLANASNAIIVGFNVRPDPVAAESAARDGVDMRFHTIIYSAIEEIETAMKGMLAPKFREVSQARIEVRQVYKISNVGMVAGSYVLEGKVTRHSLVRVVRDGIVIAEDKISGLRRFKDDVKEVASNYECGISLDKFSDVKEGDIFEAYIMEEYREQ